MTVPPSRKFPITYRSPFKAVVGTSPESESMLDKTTKYHGQTEPTAIMGGTEGADLKRFPAPLENSHTLKRCTKRAGAFPLKSRLLYLTLAN